MDIRESDQLTQRAEGILRERYTELSTALSGVVAEMLKIDTASVKPSSILLDLGAQSFDFVDVVFWLEETYGVEMPRSCLVPDTHTVDSLVRELARQLARSTSGTPDTD